ncbi:aldehyde dehydrogenase family protein [Mycobacterium sp. NPDC003449]
MADFFNHTGGWRPAASGATFQRLCPADIRTAVGDFADSAPEDVDRAVDIARSAQPEWGRRSPIERGAVLAASADLLRDRAEAIGADLSREVGKPRPEAIGEVRRAADVFDHVASLGRRPTGYTFASSAAGAELSTVSRPLGVVAAITPFNFPAFVAAFKIAAGLMAGNAVIWKPSPLTPLTGVGVVQALLDAGLPEGVLGYLTGVQAELGERLVAHPGVDAISFTGSTAIGRQVEVAAAHHGKPCQAEKGGHNPLVVFADADLERAAVAIVDGAFGGTGQKCTSTAKVLVEASVADELTEMVVQRASRVVTGPPDADGTTMGPLVSADARDRVRAAITRAVADGAEIAIGGGVPAGDAVANGHYLEPTVLTGVTPGMAIATEEVFGPTVAIVAVESRSEALDLANGTEYGLSAGIYTHSPAWIRRFTTTVRAGMLNINLPTTGVEPHAPFGGLKDSGSGPRELGPEALAFYTEQSTVALYPGE